jgi:hypothetical protein
LRFLNHRQAHPRSKKGARIRRAYRLDSPALGAHLVDHDADGIASADPRAMIAWERCIRETERAAWSTIRRRLAGSSSLDKQPPAINRSVRNWVGEVIEDR